MKNKMMFKNVKNSIIKENFNKNISEQDILKQDIPINVMTDNNKKIDDNLFLEDIKKLGQVVKINFIPDVYSYPKMEEFFKTFILGEIDLTVEENNKEMNDFIFSFGMLYLLFKAEYDFLLNVLKENLKLDEEFVQSFNNMIELKVNEAYPDEKELSKIKKDMRKEVLSKIYNVDKYIDYLDKIIKLLYSGSLQTLLKKKNIKLNDVFMITCLVYGEKPLHYRNLIKILEKEKKVEKKTLDFFEDTLKKVALPLLKIYDEQKKMELVCLAKEIGIFIFTECEVSVIVDKKAIPLEENSFNKFIEDFNISNLFFKGKM